MTDPNSKPEMTALTENGVAARVGGFNAERLWPLFFLGFFLFTLGWLSNNHSLPWHNFHLEVLAFAGLFVLLAGVLIRSRGPVVLPRASVWIALTILLPWLQYAAGISLFAGDALLSSLYLSGLLAAVCVGFAFSRAETDEAAPGLMGLMHCLWFAAMVSAAIGLTQWLNLQHLVGQYVLITYRGARAMGNLGQPNQLATLLLMGMAAFAYIYERRVIGRLGFFVGIAFMSWVLVLTQSRAGMVSVLVLSALLIWKKRSVELRLSSKAVAWWAVCFIVGTLLLPWLSEVLLLGDVRRVTSTEAIGQRLRIWQQVAYGVLQSPWLGYGWNQTPTAHAAGAIAFPGTVTYSYAHNFVLDLLAWNGIPLGLLLSGAIAWWFFSRVRASMQADALFAMACLLPLAVHSMLEFPFTYGYFLIAAGFMVGVVEAGRVSSRTIELNTRWAWGFLALWVSLGSYLTYEYSLIKKDFQVVSLENARPGKTPKNYEIPQIRMASHMAALLKVLRQTPAPDMSKADLENLRKVAQRFPYGPVHYRYAVALALNGDPQGASHQMAIIHGMLGDTYYTARKNEMRKLEKEKYPQLAAVVTP